VTEATNASRSFPRGYRRTRGIFIGAIFLFICSVFLYLSILNFTISLFRDSDPIWFFFGVAVFLSVISSIIVWAIRKIIIRGYAFDRPYVYDSIDENRNYLSLSHRVEQMLVDKDNNKIYLSTKDSIVIINCTTDDIVDEIKLRKPRFMVLNPATQRMFVMLEKGIVIIDLRSNMVTETIFKENRFTNLSIDYTTNILYAIDESYNCVDVIECSSYHLNYRIDFGEKPSGIAVNPNTNRIYIAYPKSNSLLIIDNNFNKVICKLQFENKNTAEIYELYLDSLNSKLYILRKAYYAGEGGYLDNHELYYIDANVIGSRVLDSRSSLSLHIINKSVGLCDRYSRKLSFTVNPELERIYMAVIEREDGLVVRKALFEIDSNENILQTREINDKCKSIAVNPVTNKLYVANPGSSKSIEIVSLGKERKAQRIH
jgi:DNA-binding beta-propeller fold protein YncE